MKVIYFSRAIDDTDYNLLFDDSQQQQGQKFHNLFINGFCENNVETIVVSFLNHDQFKILKNKYKSNTHKKGRITYFYFKQSRSKITSLVKRFFISLAFVLKLKGNKNVVVCDLLYAISSFGAIIGAKLRKIITIGILTDMPYLMVTGVNKKHSFLVNLNIRFIDLYIFLTNDMNLKINKKEKPYLIIEGLCDCHYKINAQSNRKKNKCKKSCVYAGYLDKLYGVEKLIDSFINIKTDATLDLYGVGPLVNKIKELSILHKNIIYHGNIKNSDMIEIEENAFLLINPRPTYEEFTKYSFPSKNIEYMLSGTPLLTTSLPGMPNDYYEYVYLFNDESVSGFHMTIKDILEKPENELYLKGKNAQEFIYKTKNNKVQIKKILLKLRELYGIF